MIQPESIRVPYRRSRMGEEPTKPSTPAPVVPADVPFYLEPLQAVTDFRGLVADARTAVRDVQLKLGDISPTVKTGIVVAAGSVGLIALLLLVDFVGLNPFRKN